MAGPAFDPHCQRCPRLVTFLAEIRADYPDYHAAPVVAFGARRPKLLIVGLAPGLHGANATGRPFTGDAAGTLLYATLHTYGFSNKTVSVSANDGLQLKQCRITNAVKCLPPRNKPNSEEINRCNTYLVHELHDCTSIQCILALGSIAHYAVLKAFNLKHAHYPFRHARVFDLPSGHKLFTSYHCSRYNTQTGRLTEPMFHDVFRQIRQHIDSIK